MDIKTILDAIDNGCLSVDEICAIRDHAFYAARKFVNNTDDMHDEIAFYGAAYSQSLTDLKEHYHDLWERTDDEEDRESDLYDAEYAIGAHISVVDLLCDIILEEEDASHRLAEELPQ